jgi:hypothetical protein
MINKFRMEKACKRLPCTTQCSLLNNCELLHFKKAHKIAKNLTVGP